MGRGVIDYKDSSNFGKYRLSASTLGSSRPYGTVSGERNHSAVLSQKTAASSNNLYTQAMAFQ